MRVTDWLKCMLIIICVCLQIQLILQTGIICVLDGS